MAKEYYIEGFPRSPIDDQERQAFVEGRSSGCMAVSALGWICCRALNHKGDHVAITPEEVVDRWPRVTHDNR